MRPAHSSSESPETELTPRAQRYPAAAFVAHILGQFDAYETVDAKTAAASYEVTAQRQTPWNLLTTYL